MSRRYSKDGLSLLDKMEEIAEEQDTDDNDHLEVEDPLAHVSDEENVDDDDDGASADDEFDDDDVDDDDEADDDDCSSGLDLSSHRVMMSGESSEHSMEQHDVFVPSPRNHPREIASEISMSLVPLYEDSVQDPYSMSVDEFYEGVSVNSALTSSDQTVPSGNRRRSFASIKSVGSSSDADLSVASAPLLFRPDASLEDSSRNQQRRITISGPKDEEGTIQNSSRRRQNLYRSVNFGASSVVAGGSSDAVTSDSSVFSSMRPKRAVFAPRRTSGRRSTRRSGTVTREGSSQLNMAEAVNRLGSHEMNSDWENAAAAAAVVAATSQAPTKRQHIQFGQDDHALVMLNLLNITNRLDDRSHFTIDPVNAYGFPAGEGKTDEERQGPYSFVLCTVRNVHFDEDERYYTIRRADTGTEQRADPGWMEQIRSLEGIVAAGRAATRTRHSEAQSPEKNAEKSGVLSRISASLSWPTRFAKNKMIPCYKSSRALTKIVVKKTLTGEHGYACKFRITCINLFVVCSFIYLLIEPVTFSLLPARLDYPSAILEFTVWCILVLELIFEFAIRPSNYWQLIQSDKAYTPSTARHINAFHLFFETIALLLFLPQIPCVFFDDCGESIPGGLVSASLNAVNGDSMNVSASGRIIIGLSFLRTFSLVRHWKQMWINNTFKGTHSSENPIVRNLLLLGQDSSALFKRKRQDEDGEENRDDEPSENAAASLNDEDKKLQMNATIGTALMLVNSHRALLLLLFIFAMFPLIYSVGLSNPSATSQVSLLQANNVASNASDDCQYLQVAVRSWLQGSAVEQPAFGVHGRRNPVFILWAQVLPVRCAWQTNGGSLPADGVITRCAPSLVEHSNACAFWNESMPPLPSEATPSYFANILGERPGVIIEYSLSEQVPSSFIASGGSTFTVRVICDEGHTLYYTMLSLFLLLLSMLLLTLVGLSVMRGDAGRLVLNPLQRMLKIVLLYAENPLSQSMSKKAKQRSAGSDSRDELGNFETEQLISAISKIADLLRKCWGVAGAGIISSNLARTKDGKTVVFNPTVPGKRVYALFGFIAINDFSKLLRDLENDVMILINDVARIVHDEVYRWALGDSGQCNKNLGSAFLMVFRIGDFSEVHDKKKRATDVVFNSQMKGHAKVRRRGSDSRRSGASGKRGKRAGSKNFDLASEGTLQLATLPGIQSFSDRALLGLLKSFAGIHRDRKLTEWKKDFRFGGGVGAFTVSVIYGMDAGWAVEGAVGSEYKIDATYLSPHVNMASRMMSATKQYGVTILLSQAVEELLSRTARSKLRHLDTVYVKGSSVAQRIFTYDARYVGVDFFLFERSPEQADLEAEAYSHNIWEIDQDLRSMRQHVTEEFMEKFREGLDQYLEGNWKVAIETLHAADNIMIKTVVEEGFVECDADNILHELYNRKSYNEEVIRIRSEFGDGACKCLIHFMQRRNGVPPADWNGVHPLMSK